MTKIYLAFKHCLGRNVDLNGLLHLSKNFAPQYRKFALQFNSKERSSGLMLGRVISILQLLLGHH